MNKYVLAGAGLLLMAGAGAAVAQAPTPPPAPPASTEQPPPRPGWGGPMRGPHGPWMRRMMENGKAAHFRFSRGENAVDIKCAADESTKACVDAAGQLLDKLGAMRQQQ